MLLWCIYFVLFMFCGATVLPKYDTNTKDNLPLDNNLLKQYHQNNFTKNDTIKIAEELNTNKPNNLEENKRKIKNKNDVDNVVNHLLTIGSFKILASVKCIKRNLQSKQNITTLIETAIQNYSSLFNGLLEKIPKDTYENDIDKVFVILNLVVTANEMVYDINKDVLRKIINGTNITNQTKINIKEELNSNYIEDKKEYLEYICMYYDICRMYPAYSDYVAVVINEILKLKRARFNYFVTNSIILFREQANFFKAFLGDKTVSKINDKLEDMFYRDISHTRKILSTLQRILIEKHKLISPNNNNNKTLLKAIVILIDMVDKVFDDDESDVLKIFFDNTIISIRNWSKLGDDGIARTMGYFIRHFVNTLKYNWKPFVRTEAKTLVDIIINGQTLNKDTYKYLFNEGSKFVKLKREIKADL